MKLNGRFGTLHSAPFHISSFPVFTFSPTSMGHCYGRLPTLTAMYAESSRQKLAIEKLKERCNSGQCVKLTGNRSRSIKLTQKSPCTCDSLCYHNLPPLPSHFLLLPHCPARPPAAIPTLLCHPSLHLFWNLDSHQPQTWFQSPGSWLLSCWGSFTI